MVVLNDTCERCNIVCNTIYFQRNFKNWTSGDNGIDKFIQHTQLSAHCNTSKTLEWIPYNRFRDIYYVAEKELGRANWIDGSIEFWYDDNQSWERVNQNMFVILKILNNSKIVTWEYMNMVKLFIIQCNC